MVVIGSKKIKSDYDRKSHARSRFKHPRNTIFLSDCQRKSGILVVRRSGHHVQGKAPTIGSTTSRLRSSSNTSTQPCKDTAGISIE